MEPVRDGRCRSASDGLARASQLGYRTHEGVEAWPGCRCSMSWTSSSTPPAPRPCRQRCLHAPHQATTVRRSTTPPAAIGPYCVPVVNGDAPDALNLNMAVTCGGQATIPIVQPPSRGEDSAYAEIIAKHLQPRCQTGRANIDKFTRNHIPCHQRPSGGAAKARRSSCSILRNTAADHARYSVCAQRRCRYRADQRSLSRAEWSRPSKYVPGCTA